MPADSPALEQERFDLVGPGYFRTMGIPLLAGRDFTDRDTAAAPRAIVISHTMARHFFGDRSPIGQRMLWRDDRAWEVVGVAADTRTRGPRDAASLRFYVPYLQQADPELASVRFAVRTMTDPVQLTSSLRRAVADADTALPTPSIETVTELLDRTLVRDSNRRAPRVRLRGARARACRDRAVRHVGLSSRTTTGRARRASGSWRTPARSAGPGPPESMQLVISGVAIGVVCALLGSRLVTSLLFGIVAADAPTYVAVVLGLLASTIIASLVPARRAAAVDPILSLKGH
jgi:putative ABC transport system permease protein